MKKEEFKNRLKDIYLIHDDIREDELDNVLKYSNSGNKRIIGGTLDKSYKNIDDNTISFMLKKYNDLMLQKTPKDSCFFRELFESLIQGNSSYVTYFNELFDGDSKYIPQYINCLVKESRGVKLGGSGKVYEEVVSPRLANLLGVKTVFNAVYSEETDNGVIDRQILSVDFTPPGCRFIKLTEIGVGFSCDTSLSWGLSLLQQNIKSVAKKEKLNYTEENTRKVCEEFVRQYLFRNALCEDYDFDAKNMGIIVDENGNYEMAPMFDYEYMFFGGKSKYHFEESNKETIRYCRKNYPEVLDVFMTRLQYAQENNQIENVLENTINVKEYYKEPAIETLSRSIPKLLEYWENSKESVNNM